MRGVVHAVQATAGLAALALAIVQDFAATPAALGGRYPQLSARYPQRGATGVRRYLHFPRARTSSDAWPAPGGDAIRPCPPGSRGKMRVSMKVATSMTTAFSPSYARCTAHQLTIEWE